MNTILKNKILLFALAVIAIIAAFIIYYSTSNNNFSSKEANIKEIQKELADIEGIAGELKPEPLDTEIDFGVVEPEPQTDAESNQEDIKADVGTESPIKTPDAPKTVKSDNSGLDSIENDMGSAIESTNDLDNIDGELKEDNLEFDLGI